MSEEHVHKMRYTVVLNDGHWWKGKTRLVLVGTSSSLKDGELLIFDGNDGFTSINYARVVLMTAEKI
ncbi:MAG TPA: hypothetical protein VK657_10795 [Terriglobales bacterium]|nr:hypothetical protein [Terriglobales bacterium]